MNHRNAILLQALVAVLFSTSGFLIKIITVPALAFVGIRSLIALIVIALCMGRPRFTFTLPQIGGAVALLGAQLFYVLATRQTSAAAAIFLQYTAPVYVAIFGAWFLHEPVKRADWLTMLVVFIGMAFFFREGLSVQGMWGLINGILSSITFAWFILLLRKQKDASTIETVFLGNLLATLVGLPFALQSHPTGPEWLGLIFLGIFQLGLPFVLMSIAIKYLTAVETVLIQTLEPILNPIWVVLVVGEVPSPGAMLGGLLVLVAVTTRSLFAARRT